MDTLSKLKEAYKDMRKDIPNIEKHRVILNDILQTLYNEIGEIKGIKEYQKIVKTYRA